MSLSPEALRRADEIAAAAPPLTDEQRRTIRLILWGTSMPLVSAETPTESPEAA